VGPARRAVHPISHRITRWISAALVFHVEVVAIGQWGLGVRHQVSGKLGLLLRDEGVIDNVSDLLVQLLRRDRRRPCVLRGRAPLRPERIVGGRRRSRRLRAASCGRSAAAGQPAGQEKGDCKNWWNDKKASRRFRAREHSGSVRKECTRIPAAIKMPECYSVRPFVYGHRSVFLGEALRAAPCSGRRKTPAVISPAPGERPPHSTAAAYPSGMAPAELVRC